jgi:CubicO group peptidase (beta-lactamase class C family)
MSSLRRREFGGALLALGAGARSAAGGGTLDETLREGLKRRKIPAAVAMVATADKIAYSGAFGTRDAESGAAVTADSIFGIASMTKPITTVAAMQLIEKRTLTLDEPVSKHLPELEKLDVLEGFDNMNRPMLRPAAKPVTLRMLLTHTSGFVYDTWDEKLFLYGKHEHAAAPFPPLGFQPGARWEYGTSIDWTGRLVETVTSQTLEDYFQHNILGPLGMKDTSFIVAPDKFDRLVTGYQRQSDGSLKPNARKAPTPPKSFNGGGGLTSTAGDYVRFMQMILRRGRAGDQRILRAETVDRMASNQIGDLSAGKLRTFRPDVSNDVDFHPGVADRWGFGFLLNTTAYDGGRSAGSLAWAGIANTFFWIDLHKSICAVLLMQFLPFCDPEAVGMLRDFERAVYAA